MISNLGNTGRIELGFHRLSRCLSGLVTCFGFSSLQALEFRA